ncbi:ATP-binding protein [Methanococcus aeolicus]|uniref:ATP-binding protein n=1 Tax=Methanococcus aeolicus TaxID=42879 RepID=UPI00014FB848|nr:ATP-binding protein [Methanococcus aeolicus]UXM84067.1 ATP-binding protein [Methanococcus aeolicus]
MNKIGVVYEDTGISECQIMCDKKIRFGEFVLLKNIDNIEVLGIIKNIRAKDDKLLGVVSIVGALNGQNLLPNRSPIKPNSEALLGDDSILSKLYYDNKGLNVGHLLTRDSVRVYLNTNKLISRHFAVLAVTGGGKSNTIAVLCRELAKINATTVIIDPHGEYMSMSHEDMEGRLNPMTAKLDPSIMSPSEFADLIGLKEDNRKERIFLNMAFHTIK